jgi:ABC-2 type transport system ATP-binding protein
VDLVDQRGTLLSDASGGMQRRIALAATLVHDPELLYLDEPTAGVDPILRERFWTHFRELRDQGRTIVVPTQYVGEAVSCDSVAVMAHGRIVTVQPPSMLASFAYGGEPLVVPFNDRWPSQTDVNRLLALPTVRGVERIPEGLIVVVEGDADVSIAALEQHAQANGLDETGITRYEPSFDDIFVKIIEAQTPDASAAA